MPQLSSLHAHRRRAAILIGKKIWQALNARPMTQPEQVDLAMAERSAFDDMTHGRGIADHLDNLACASYVSLVLAERGYCPKCEDKIKDAQLALMCVKHRHAPGTRAGQRGARRMGD